MKATAAMIGFCLRQGIDVEEVRSDKRDTKHVRQRRKVARYLRNEGFSYPDIAHAMQKHHTSIMNLLCDKLQKKKKKTYLHVMEIKNGK
jgi:DNA-binding transcriptional MerR regulator